MKSISYYGGVRHVMSCRKKRLSGLILLELLAQGDGRVLVRRAYGRTVGHRRRPHHALEKEFAEGLAVGYHERHVMRPYLQDRLCARYLARVSVTEARVEKPRVMSAQFPASRLVGKHLGRVGDGDSCLFLGREHVEFLGLEYEGILVVAIKRLPKIRGLVIVFLCVVDDVAVFLGLIAYDIASRVPLKINAHEYAARYPDLF